MPLASLNHRYFGRKILTSYSKTDLLTGLIQHLTSTTYADGSLRSSGPSNWTWTQSGDAIIGSPPVDNIGFRIVIAVTGASSPSGVTFRNGFVANSIVVGMAKGIVAGATFSTWDNSSGNPFQIGSPPAPAGSFSGYINILENTSGWGTIESSYWLAWESQQTAWIQFFYKKQGVNETFTKLIFAGAAIDPQTGDAVDGESDNALYSLFASGSGDQTSSGRPNILGSLSGDDRILYSTNNANTGRWYSFIPGSSSLLHCMRLFAVPDFTTSLTMTTRTGKYPRIPIYVSNTALDNPLGVPICWAGKLREVFYCKDSTSGQVLIDGTTVAGYTVSNSFAGAFLGQIGDTLFLKY